MSKSAFGLVSAETVTRPRIRADEVRVDFRHQLGDHRAVRIFQRDNVDHGHGDGAQAFDFLDDAGQLFDVAGIATEDQGIQVVQAFDLDVTPKLSQPARVSFGVSSFGSVPAGF